MHKHLAWVLPLSLGTIILSAWYFLVESGRINPFMLPSPRVVIEKLWTESDRLGIAAWRTFLVSILGFVAASGGGFLIALVLASNRYVKHTLYPFILIFQMTPIIIMIPMIGIWVGPGLGSIIIVTFVIGFFPVVANTVTGLMSTDKNLLNLFVMGNAKKSQELMQLRIPYAMPYFLTGMKIAGTLAPIGALTGDFLLGSSTSGGLGYMILVYKANTDTPALFTLGLVTCVLGFLFVGSVNLIHYLLLRDWHDSYQTQES
ncbi:MAG: ABC transporter permease [Opitutales bacterium]|nr:ABC transporter permease [Opitutales bacterium]